MKIVLITRDRAELTLQTVRTMEDNATRWLAHDLIVVYDGPVEDEIAQRLIRDLPPHTLVPTGKQLGVGGAKNFGVEVFERREQDGWGEDLDPDTIIMFSDNDMYYLPNWDKRLEEALGFRDIKQIGGWRHPFHGPSGFAINITSDGSEGLVGVDAVTGNCFIVLYKDWLKYGPFDSNALGPGQSEDFALSRKIVEAGELIATLDPPVAIHCGLANCEGKPAVGWEEMAKMAEKQLKENNIDKIWLETPDEGTILLEKAIPEKLSLLNVGSGQRRFDTQYGWCNVDCVSRPPDQVPDVVLDANELVAKFGENTQDMVVLHHVLEHFGCGEADKVLDQCFRCLKPGGSLLVFVPDLRKLAGRWLSGELDDFSYMVNVYGAYQGLEGDRHKWGYDLDSLYKYLQTIPGTGQIIPFDWREIPGADIAKDWWILGMEIVKDGGA